MESTLKTKNNGKK